MSRCGQCGLLASALEPCIPDAKSTTPIDEASRSRGLSATRRANHLLILSKILELRGSHFGRLLDVGCGHGLFLRDASDAGYDVTGIEPDANVVEYARRIGNANFIHGFFPSAVPLSSKFDVITFNDVLEHLPDPAAVVAVASDMLSSGGVLVLNCPSRSGIFYRAATALASLGWRPPLHRLWQVGLPSPHLWYFSPDGLITLGQRFGLHPLCALPLSTLSRDGLRDRVSYVRNQSAVLTVLTTLGVSAALPLLRYLPKDSHAVLLRKN